MQHKLQKLKNVEDQVFANLQSSWHLKVLHEITNTQTAVQNKTQHKLKHHTTQKERTGGEVLVVLHVVDVRPLRLQRDARGGVVGHDVLDVLQILVAPAAVVEAQRPVGHHRGLTYDLPCSNR